MLLWWSFIILIPVLLIIGFYCLLVHITTKTGSSSETKPYHTQVGTHRAEALIALRHGWLENGPLIRKTWICNDTTDGRIWIPTTPGCCICSSWILLDQPINH